VTNKWWVRPTLIKLYSTKSVHWHFNLRRSVG
jgi:hypothetical protein